MKKTILILVLALIVGLTFYTIEGNTQMGSRMMGPGMMGQRSPYLGKKFKTVGEQIYYTGIGGNGDPISIYGGPMWLRMHGGGCMSCHGTNGKGGVPVMMGTKIPEDIRYKTLTKKGYTDGLIKRAITQGKEEDGKVMDWTMPRWQMSEADLDALIEYLKTLE